MSRQATLTDDATGKKSGVQGWHNAARLALLDPSLLVSVPPAGDLARIVESCLQGWA